MLSIYLIFFLIVIYIIQLVVPGFTEVFIFDPNLMASQPWRLITSVFLHSPTDVTHILFNCYALFLFGSILESRVTKNEYWVLFFGAGLVGSLLFYAVILLGLAPPALALGASGAIFGLIGAVAAMMPNMRIFVMFIPMTMRTAALFWVAISIIGTLDTTSTIGHMAHLGGLVFGWAYGKHLINNKITPVEVPISEKDGTFT
ncbi:MAG: rhomboid family intramembrane serine protease [Candidatus Micrarchaeota archaeon]